MFGEGEEVMERREAAERTEREEDSLVRSRSGQRYSLQRTSVQLQEKGEREREQLARCLEEGGG